MKSKRLFIIVFLIFVVLAFLHLFAIFDTNSVLADFKTVVTNDNVSEELLSTKLSHYYNENANDNLTQVDISRRFVCHNFKSGVMYVNYTFKISDGNGVLLRGSHNVDSKWYIEKVCGKWVVTDIVEKP